MEKHFLIAPEHAGHAGGRVALLDKVMGPGRFRRTSERLREGREPEAGLCRVAMRDGALVGTVRLWRVRADGMDDALLLGPLAVDCECQGLGIGGALMAEVIEAARMAGHGAIVLVGDAPYYARFGFAAEATRHLAMPGPFERHRLLALELQAGALDRAYGILQPSAPEAAPAIAAEPVVAA